jgi:predicted nucleotidyltransferase
MDKNEIINIAKKYKEYIKTKIDFDELFLFGSYAKGNPREHSDIDIAVVVDTFSGDYMKTVQQLWLLRKDIDVRIEPILIIKSEDIPGFLEEIKRTGILIN